MSRLILVRHAAPVATAAGRVYGTLDVGLSDEGRAHAVRLAEWLERFAVTAVYSSPRRRALETAELIAPSPIVEDDLRELDFGELEGRTYEEIETAAPELYRTWMETPTEVRFPGGESYADLHMRAVRALDEIRAREECAVVVAHGGVIRAGLAAWLDLPAASIFRLAQDYCGVSIVDWVEEVPIVRLLNYVRSAKSAADGR